MRRNTHLPRWLRKDSTSPPPCAGRGITAQGSLTLQNSSRTMRKSSPLLEEKAPGTFSHMAYRGRTGSFARLLVSSLISLITRICSINKPLLSPPSPALCPATDRSWQGEPPAIISTGSISRPLIFVISPSCFMFGNRLAVTSHGNFSISLLHTGVIPHSCAAKGIVPAPSNKLPKVIFMFL